jgi:hypothetical protein
MFKTFLTTDRLLQFIPTLTTFRGDSVTFENEISNASDEVAVDLVNMGYKLDQIYIPLMLKSSKQPYETWIETANTTGDFFDSHNENILVVECKSISDSVTILLDGSFDSGVTWVNIGNITFTEAGNYSLSFKERWSSYRYRSVITSSTTYSIYLVNAPAELLVIYQAGRNILLPHLIKGENVKSLYDALGEKYQNLLSSIKFDVDSNESGAIDDFDIRSNSTVTICG